MGLSGDPFLFFQSKYLSKRQMNIHFFNIHIGHEHLFPADAQLSQYSQSFIHPIPVYPKRRTFGRKMCNFNMIFFAEQQKKTTFAKIYAL